MDPIPLVSHTYTPDPSAHVFKTRIYIYSSHDVDTGKPEDFDGDHFDMQGYHVFSSSSPDAPVTDHGVALKIQDFAWTQRELWAPDTAEATGTYVLYLSAREHR